MPAGPRPSCEREPEGLRARSAALIWPPATVVLHLFSIGLCRATRDKSSRLRLAPSLKKRSPFVGLQEATGPGRGPMSLPVDALPRKSVPGLSQLGKITLPFRLASKITRGAMAMFRASSLRSPVARGSAQRILSRIFRPK